MPDLQPGQRQVYGVPETDAPVTSEEVRQLVEALARNFYTDDDAFPADPRAGQFRVLVDVPTNKKLQIFIDGAFKTILQNIGSGLASPIKQIVQFDTPLTSWVIDHNLGSQVFIQVYDSSWNLLQAAAAGAQTQTVFLGSLSPAILTTLAPGTTVLRPALPVDFNGNFLRAYAVAAEDLTGAPAGQIEFEIAGQGVMSGGTIPLAAAALGVTLSGPNAVANNLLTAGGTLEVRANMAAIPTGGSLELYGVTSRSLASGSYGAQHINENRVIVTHPVPTDGFAILVG